MDIQYQEMSNNKLARVQNVRIRDEQLTLPWWLPELEGNNKSAISTVTWQDFWERVVKWRN